MTLREWWNSTLDYITGMWWTISTTNVLDWPISYFLYLPALALLAVVLTGAAVGIFFALLEFAQELLDPVTSRARRLFRPVARAKGRFDGWISFEKEEGAKGALRSALRLALASFAFMSAFGTIVFGLDARLADFLDVVAFTLVASAAVFALVLVYAFVANLLLLR